MAYATEAQLSEECSDEALKDLSNVLSSYHSYRYMLGLTDVEINEIDNDPRTFYSTQAKFFSALKKWKSKNIDFDCPSRSNATYARLLEIAKKARDGLSVRQINKVCVEAASKGSEYGQFDAYHNVVNELLDTPNFCLPLPQPFLLRHVSCLGTIPLGHT